MHLRANIGMNYFCILRPSNNTSAYWSQDPSFEGELRTCDVSGNPQHIRPVRAELKSSSRALIPSLERLAAQDCFFYHVAGYIDQLTVNTTESRTWRGEIDISPQILRDQAISETDS